MANLKNTIINDTGYFKLPVGTTAQRPSSPQVGYMRYNTTESMYEAWDGSSWQFLSITVPSPIITNGLILHLDAGDSTSYPGSGTTLYDLSGNGYNGTLTNGGTYSSEAGGVITLDGTNDYIYIPIDLRNGNYTIMGAARYVTIGGRTFSSNNNNWLMGHWSSSTTKHYAQGWVTDTSSTENSDTAWRIYTATRSSDNWSFYVNNSLDTANTAGSQGPYNFAIGSTGGSSEFSNSNISFLIIYNRVLTSTEMTQNYNALKGRFGL